MSLAFSLKIDTKELENYAPEKNKQLAKVVKKHALIIAGEASRDAPVDTGNLRNTLADGAKKVDELNWTVSDATDYGVHQELGTKSIPAKHFLGGACERDAESFFEDIEEVLKEVKSE